MPPALLSCAQVKEEVSNQRLLNEALTKQLNDELKAAKAAKCEALEKEAALTNDRAKMQQERAQVGAGEGKGGGGADQ